MTDPNPYDSPDGPSPTGFPDTPRSLPEHILTARTREGAEVTERVEALSGDAAVDILRQRGYSDIILHTDDVTALYRQPDATKRYVSARDYIGFRTSGGGTYLRHWPFFLLDVGILVVRRILGSHWGPWDNLLLGLLVAPLALAVIGELVAPVHAYRRLIEEVSWGRWQAVLKRLSRLHSRIPDQEYRFRCAGALAGLGQLDEAVRLVQPLANGVPMPQWLYLGRLAEVYLIAKAPDQAMVCYEKAVEIAPDNVTILVDFAVNLLEHHRDVRRARKLLEKARTHAIGDMVEPSVIAAEGILALEEGDPASAKRLLEDSIAKAKPFERANALVSAAADHRRAYLVLAYAALADTATAEWHFRRAEPRLRALRLDPLLSRCEQALGIAKNSE